MIGRMAVLTGLLTTFMALVATSALACDYSSWLLAEGAPRPGGAMTVRGGGFDPGSITLVWERSGGAVLAEAVVSADGRLATDIVVPAEAGGAHKIVAVRAGAEGSAADPHAWTDVLVAAAGGRASAASVPIEDGDAGRSLPRRLALPLLVVVFAGAVARRRRRRASVIEPAPRCDDVIDLELQQLVDELGPDGRTPCADGHRGSHARV